MQPKNDAPVPESSPNTVDTAGETEPVEVALDPIGIVKPGDTDATSNGMSTLLVRSLGMGDSGDYSGGAVDRIKKIQVELGLEPDGVVDISVWPSVLREVSLGESGHEVTILRGLLGMTRAGSFDEEVLELRGNRSWADLVKKDEKSDG